MPPSESVREIRSGSHGSGARNGERRPRADRIEVDFSWSDGRESGRSEAPPRRSASRSHADHHHPDRSQSDRHHSERNQADHSPAARHPAPAPSEPPVEDLRPPAGTTITLSRNGSFDEAIAALEASQERAARHAPAPAPAPSTSGEATRTETPERRTIVIRGTGARIHGSSRGGYEARLRRHERSGFKPDRVALWAVLLGLALLLGAVTSSHAAVLHPSVQHLLHHTFTHRTGLTHHVREGLRHRL